MGFLRRFAGFLGFSKDEPHEVKDDEEDDTDNQRNPYREEARLPTKGFSVPVQVAVDRTHLGPVLVPCGLADGGVQGLRWYAKRLRIDEDGDVADEFLTEIMPQTTSDNIEVHNRPFPKFEVKYSTRPAKVRSQALSHDGTIHQFVECHGRLQVV